MGIWFHPHLPVPRPTLLLLHYILNVVSWGWMCPPDKGSSCSCCWAIRFNNNADNSAFLRSGLNQGSDMDTCTLKTGMRYLSDLDVFLLSDLVRLSCALFQKQIEQSDRQSSPHFCHLRANLLLHNISPGCMFA